MFTSVSTNPYKAHSKPGKCAEMKCGWGKIQFKLQERRQIKF